MTFRAALGLAAALLWAASAEGAAVTARLVPAAAQLAPGDSVDVDVRIEAGEAWNGYEIAVTYDADRLAAAALPLEEAEGVLMTAACPERWHHLTASPGRIVLSHVLLCPGARVTGPGVLYRFRFASRGAAGPAAIGIEAARFLDAGQDLAPVETHGATVLVGEGTPVRPISWGGLKRRTLPGSNPGPSR